MRKVSYLSNKNTDLKTFKGLFKITSIHMKYDLKSVKNNKFNETDCNEENMYICEKVHGEIKKVESHIDKRQTTFQLVIRQISQQSNIQFSSVSFFKI